MRQLKALLVVFLVISPAQAENLVNIPLNESRCETFSVGESGHSDWCEGPFGYGLVLHHRNARIDLEITRPGESRNENVHRLVDFLGEGQRTLLELSTRWLTENGKATALALHFDVEPQAYELFIPLTLVFRVSEDKPDCVIATIGEGSKRVVDEVLSGYEEATCRPAFPR